MAATRLEARQFDTSRESNALAQSRAFGRNLALGLTIMFLIIGAGLNLAIQTPLKNPGSRPWVVTGVAVAELVWVTGAIGCLWLYLALRPGPVRVTVSDGGLRLDFATGTAVRLGWTTGAWQIEDFSEYPTIASQPGGPYFLNVNWGRRFTISEEAMEGVLDLARSVGVSVATVRGSSVLYGFSPNIYRLRGGPPDRK